MAKNRKRRSSRDETLVDIVEVKEQAQSFIDKNQLLIVGIGAAVVLIVGGFIIYSMLYKAPKEEAASEQLFKAEYQFQQDSFALALESPGAGYEGFLDIVDNYGGTKAGNLARYYAGVSYLNIGRFEDAISYLEGFNPKGDISPIMKFGALGDAYSELANYEEALKRYSKATTYKNEILTPYYLNKLGLLHRRQGNNQEARKAFEKIANDYPKSTEATDVDKYLALFQ